VRRILRNSIRQHLKTIFRGKEIMFKSKSTQAFNMDNEEDKAKYDHWLKIYGGLIYDDTRPEYLKGRDNL